ncbi:MAG: nitrilase-related carbon-nitrogen hydrolase [Terriglobia bacterium]
MKPLLQTRAGRIVAALISGVLFYFVFGLNPYWLAAWLAPIPLLLAAFHAGGREARALAWLASAIGLSSQFAYYWKVTGPVATIVLLILQILLWGFIIGRTRAAVISSSHGLTLFVYPVILAAVDTLVAFFSPHGTAGSMAFGQMDFLPVVQIASVLGAPAIVFLVSLFASTLAVGLYRGREISRPWLTYGLAAAILLSALGWGAFRLHAAVPGPSIKVGLVAVDDFVGPGVPGSRAEAVWAAYDQGVRKLATEGAHIVVLPEKVFYLAPDEAVERRKQFAALARESGVYLVVGLQLNQPDRKRNVSWLFNPSGDLLAEYDKQHMVPHLEGDLAPGRENIVRRIDGDPYGLVICRDMFFAGLTRAYSRLGVAALLIPAWDFYVDAWWASRVAALGGVEGGYSVARASRESFLAVSDRYGHILAEKRSDFLPGASLLASLPLGPATPTPYARFGDVFGWLCVAGAVLAVVLPRLKRS